MNQRATLAKLQFGTKAATINALRGMLKCSLVCDCAIFTVAEWRESRDSIIAGIRSQFSPSRIIVRSSALNEDDETCSMAGAYLSIKDVESDSAEEVEAAIESVIDSYGMDHPDGNEVLVQPMIADVSMSGVVFSHDLSTGAPYYVVNYDDISGLTDTVTSGTTDTSRTLLIHRNHIGELQSPRFRALLRSVQEIEELADSPGVDLEFAVTHSEDIYIFQARRMALSQNWNRDIAQHIDASLGEIHRFLDASFRPKSGVFGKTTVLGEMPDWNPAEMIGTVPRPLARSLYEKLITNSVWAEARAEMGYRNLGGRPLMVNLGGRVFIDVRESFNSFLPVELPPVIAEKLVNAWVAHLKAYPELHDKVEFEVAITAYALDFEDRMASFAHDLSTMETAQFRDCLLRLTKKIIASPSGADDFQHSRLRDLEARRTALLAGCREGDELDIVRQLLMDCASLGTRAFSVFARRGFIAEALLRSLVSQGVFSSERAAAFRASVPTVLSGFLDSMRASAESKGGRQAFLDAFGHLRPGTYDILASRYDQHEELACSGLTEGIGAPRHTPDFELTRMEVSEVEAALDRAGLDISAQPLFDFMREAISGREFAKLVFTRNVSEALELIAKWGIRTGLSRDELSFLTIDEILGALVTSFHKPQESHFRGIARESRQTYQVSQSLRLPYLLASTSDIYVVPLLKSRANFITGKRVQGPIHYLSDHAMQTGRAGGKVVLIERADPGYDWIFLSPIAGLITKYGGSNSHMAIRCAELDVPAAIGCGEQVFDQLQRSNSVLLDCAAGMLVPIR